MDDEALLRRAGEGDEAAFTALHARWAPRVLNYLRAALGGRSDWAEDCLQEVFLAVRTARFEGSGSFRSWLFAIAHRRAMDLHRRESRPAPPVRTRPAPDPRLQEALSALPEEARAAVLLVHMQGMTQAEAAAALGATEHRVRELLKAGMARLRADLES